MPGTFGPAARRRLETAVKQAIDALDLWLEEVSSLQELPGDGLYYPDSLEVSTAALFDRVPIEPLLMVLQRRETEDEPNGRLA